MMEMNLLQDWPAPSGSARVFMASDASRACFAESPDRGVPPSEIQRAALDSSLENSAYMRGNAVRILGASFKIFDVYDDTAFRKACEAHLRRHDVYHTGFVRENGDWSSRTIAPADISLAGRDLSLSKESASAEFDQYIESHQARIPDWDLFSYSALGIDQATPDAKTPVFTVAICMDHLLTDGFSIFMVFEEILAFYEMFRAGAFDESALPETASHADYARRDAEFCAGLTIDSPQVQEWQRFKDLNGGRLPGFTFDTGLVGDDDFARSCITTIPDFLSVVEAEAFEARCREAGGSLSAGFMAVAALIDRLVHGSHRFTVCTPRSTRQSRAEHYTMGWFAHPVPLEFLVADSFSNLVSTVRQANKSVRFMVGVPVYPAQKILAQSADATSMPPEMTSLSFIDTRLIPTHRDLAEHAFTVIGTRRNAKSVHYWVNRVGHGVNLSFMHPDTSALAAGIGAFSALFAAIVREVVEAGDLDLVEQGERLQAIIDEHGARPALRHAA